MAPDHCDGAVVSPPTEDRGPGEEREAHYTGPWWRFSPLRNAIVSGLLLGLSFAVARLGLVPDALPIALAIGAIAFGASHWGREALESIQRLRINIDVLMGVATLGAAILGLWEEAAFLAFLYGGAEALEEFTYSRTRSAIRSLLDLAPREAHLLRDGTEQLVPATNLAPGDHFLVRPGGAVPTDGIIRRGATSLNEAPITGESVPVEKQPGMTIFAGTVNLTGAIEVEVTRAFEDNTLSRIIHLVEEAQEQKTNAQRFIDRFGARYSPAILLAALALLLIPLLLGGDLREWAVRAITLTVAGAPCALVMSTPVAVAAAIGSAGKRGVLIKGGIHLENLGLVRVVAFDKTGTLTTGEPLVTDVTPLAKLDQAAVLSLAAAVEAYSEHPLAQAIVRRARADGLSLPGAEAFQAQTGAGARARVNGTDVYVGSLALFQQLGASLNGAEALAQRQYEQGKTVVLVGGQDGALGLLAIRDEVRPGARDAIEALRRVGIAKIAMLTGDNRRTALAIARELGISEVKAELQPGAKSAALRDLQAELGPAAMVGGGINDAPALATATVGIAMGTAGTDAAIEAADGP